MFPAEFERRYRGRRGFIENDRGLTNTPELLAGENPHDEFHAEKLRAGRDDVRTRMTTNNLSEIYELNKGGYAMSAREYLKRPSLRSLPARRRVGGVLKDNAQRRKILNRRVRDLDMEPYEKLELTSKDITLPPIPTEQPPIMTQENALFNNIKLNLGAINDFLANDISATNISALVPVEYKNIQQYLRNLVRDQYQAGWKFDIPQFNSLNSLQIDVINNLENVLLELVEEGFDIAELDTSRRESLKVLLNTLIIQLARAQAGFLQQFYNAQEFGDDMRSRRASAPSLSAKRAVRRGGTLTRQKRSYLPVNTLDEAENVPLFSNIVALYVALDIGKMRLVKTIPDATPLDIGELESVAETEASYPSAELESRLAETEGDIDKLLEMKKAELSKAYRGLFGVNPPQRARKPDIAEAISAFIQGQANIPTPAGSIVPPPPSVAQTLPSINEGDGGGEGGITGSGRPYYAPTLAGRWSIYNSVPQKQRSLTARRTLETALNKPLPPFTFTHTTRSNRQQRKAIERRTNQRRLAQQRASRIQVEKNTKREILDPTYFSREILDEDDE